MMRQNVIRTVRELLTAGAVSAPLAGCGPSTPTSNDIVRYLDDRAYRRAELAASLVNAENGYSRIRLAHYDTGAPDDWSRLPEWNPATESPSTAELDRGVGTSTTALSSAAAALSLPEGVASEDDPRLIALGRVAFERYPVQLAPYWSVALASRDAAAKYGLWVDDRRGIGGLVRAQMGDGSTALAMTCATCHASETANGIVDGLPNAKLDLGQALIDAALPIDPTVVASLRDWGRGRLDVTTSTETEPVRIPDLRPVRWLTHLHHDATLLQRNRTTLAIRIETLIVASSGQVLRPPRVVALALAAYLVSLGEALPMGAELAESRGADVFASLCASCHAPGSLTGPPVALDVIGTDPSLGLSLDRGTGTYRVPSLHGVGSRGPLLHDGNVPSIEAMFDPSRPTPAFTRRLHGSGAVPGHLFGLSLSETDRSALVSYLKTL